MGKGTYLVASFYLFLFFGMGLAGRLSAQSFWLESWESSILGTYVPNDNNPVLINGDRGSWLVDDTVSSFLDDGCGPDQSKAEILSDQGSKFLKLTSAISPGDCAENIWVLLDNRISPLSVSITPDTRISFSETGFLEDPFWNGSFPTFTPPPGSNVHLGLEDNEGNVLVYIIQRASNYPAHTQAFSSGNVSVGYHEVLLDRNGGTFNRSLHSDFLNVPGFNTNNVIRSIKFEITDLGFATLADLKIGEFEPPNKVSVPNIVGLNQDSAKLALNAAGLLVGLISFENSDTVAAGIVIRQEPADGNEIDEGGLVNLVVSLGALVTVPNVVGLTQIEAETLITSADLMVGMIMEENHNSVPQGTVISQDPNGGTEVTAGVSVNFVLSLGPPPPVEFIVNVISDGGADGSPGDGVCETAVGTGECSLRAAIQEANSSSGINKISFSIPGNGPHTIKPNSALPTITESLILDGYSQPGASANSLGSGNNAVFLVELDGTLAGQNSPGLFILASNCIIKGLVINRFSGSGIRLVNFGKNTVEGNLIGTDNTGISRLGNGFSGISISSSNDNIIGGSSAESRNIISGNGASGIDIQNSQRILIQGNFIGTDSSGTVDLGNAIDGILLGVASGTIVGGETLSERNLISGNDRFGVDLSSSARDCKVQGNFIGTDVTGTLGIGNLSGMAIAGSDNQIIDNLISGNQGLGIQIDGFTQMNGTSDNLIQKNLIGADHTGTNPLGNESHGILFRIGSIPGFAPVDNTIGGESENEGNVIAFNQGAGIWLIDGNQNRILSNSIHSNEGLGIDLGTLGKTGNDMLDADEGPNQLLNFPELTVAISASSTTLIGKLNSMPNHEITVQFFSNALCDSSGHGEGQILIASIQIVTNNSGMAIFEKEIPSVIAEGHFITATATDVNGNTSEFSECVQVITSGMVKVPDFTNLPISEVEDPLTLAGLELGSISSINSTEFPPGTIVSQNPAFDTALPFKGSIDLFISSSEIIELKIGWNLISTQGQFPLNSIQPIPANQFKYVAWYFEKGNFHIAKEFSPSKGYWIHSFTNASLVLPIQ